MPLIAPKPFAEYTAAEYHTYVSEMYALPAKRGTKSRSPVGPAPGLRVGCTKRGKLSIRRTKVRPFAYVTVAEIVALAAAATCSQTDLWNAFKSRKFIIAKDRMEAETIYSELKNMPF